MSSPGVKLESKVAEMRRLFDESFAILPAKNPARWQPMLAIGVAGEPMAVRLADIVTLTKVKGAVLPVPSSVPELLGLSGIRGSVVPVFSLRALLGLRALAAVELGESRWLLLCGQKHAPVALAFEHFEEYMQVETENVFPASAAENAHGYIAKSVRHEGILRALIDVPKIVAHIMAHATTPAK